MVKTWKDAFNRPIVVGSRVAYYRRMPGGGGSMFVVGKITAAADLGPDMFVKIEMTRNSVAQLEKYSRGLRRRRVNPIEPSISTYSLILVSEDVDVASD